MTYIDHVTFHVPRGTFDLGPISSDIGVFWDMLGFIEIEPEEEPFAGTVRWFQARGEDWQPLVHCIDAVVVPPMPFQDQPGLGHLAIAADPQMFSAIKTIATQKGWLDRDSGSGRFWVRYENIRVEVRPAGDWERPHAA
jgi:hypothetical protein